jgi:hypothetical protein
MKPLVTPPSPVWRAADRQKELQDARGWRRRRPVEIAPVYDEASSPEDTWWPVEFEKDVFSGLGEGEGGAGRDQWSRELDQSAGRARARRVPRGPTLMPTYEVSCEGCGELRCPMLPERPMTYTCVRCGCASPRRGSGGRRRRPGGRASRSLGRPLDA